MVCDAHGFGMEKLIGTRRSEYLPVAELIVFRSGSYVVFACPARRPGRGSTQPPSDLRIPRNKLRPDLIFFPGPCWSLQPMSTVVSPLSRTTGPLAPDGSSPRCSTPAPGFIEQPWVHYLILGSFLVFTLPLCVLAATGRHLSRALVGGLALPLCPGHDSFRPDADHLPAKHQPDVFQQQLEEASGVLSHPRR